LFDAAEKKSQTLISFGGAYSNHIVATACAAKEAGFASVGIIRGEPAIHPSPALQTATDCGMHLQFISRSAYKRKTEPDFLMSLSEKFPSPYIIPEGGSGKAGVKGSEEILEFIEKDRYSHILCAIGTGTMWLGLANAAKLQQYVHGICVLKGMPDLLGEFGEQLNNPQKTDYCRIHYEYHFGGYAKKNQELIHFMNKLYKKTGIATDFVYTAKLFYAVTDLVSKNYFPTGSRLLLIHSGGLQGNRSLPAGTLNF
jgi:1-aminocyclopropane-1-carboxylate deaminase/D-cysteine desulfhydrase-like pyridoxal-dependent ACC family enzyme